MDASHDTNDGGNGHIIIKNMKNQSIMLISLLAVGAGLAFGYTLWGSPTNMEKPMKQSADSAVPTGMHRMPDGSMMGNASTNNSSGMMGGMDHSDMMVKSERELIEGMIPHHQEAIDTSKEVVARGGSTPEIKKLAEGIILAQEKEINMMKGWYQSWYGKAYVADPNAYTPMMRDLSNLQGAALDKVYLEDMVMHHMGAIMMAQSVQPYIEHKEVKELSKAIIDSQSREIKEMQAFLTKLEN